MSLMKWPGTTDKTSDKPDLSSLSDDQLDDLMVAAGLTEQETLDRQHDSRLLSALANLPGGPPDYCETLRGLIRLRNEGPFPFEAQDLYDHLHVRAEADVKAARKAATKAIPSPVDVPADMSVAGWLRAKWNSADEVVRNALQAVANVVGVSVPMSRTRKSSEGGRDSPSTRRAEVGLQPNRDDFEPLEIPAEAEEAEEPHYHGPPEWHDDDADGWQPCSSLHDALHLDPEDHGGS